MATNTPRPNSWTAADRSLKEVRRLGSGRNLVAVLLDDGYKSLSLYSNGAPDSIL
jgi:hypothetical protein